MMQVEANIKEDVRKYFKYYENEIIPVIKTIPEVTQKDYGFHGFYTHTDAVVFRGIYYAVSLGEDPIPVIFACAFHDLARTDDEYNEIHGEAAVPICKKVLEQFSDILTEEQNESIVYAVRNHTTGRNAPDYVSACLWDADRTRLGWIYGYKEDFMNTDEAKRIASGRAKEFLEFQNECLGRDIDDDREGVLKK